MKRFFTPLLAVGAVLGTAASALADAAPVVDLTSAGTAGATAVTTGGTAALPIFGAMVAIGAVVMGFRRLAH